MTAESEPRRVSDPVLAELVDQVVRLNRSVGKMSGELRHVGKIDKKVGDLYGRVEHLMVLQEFDQASHAGIHAEAAETRALVVDLRDRIPSIPPDVHALDHQVIGEIREERDRDRRRQERKREFWRRVGEKSVEAMADNGVRGLMRLLWVPVAVLTALWWQDLIDIGQRLAAWWRAHH